MSIRTRALSTAGCCALSGVAALVITAPSAAADPPAPTPPPPADTTSQPAAGEPASPPPEVPHLLSPENLPPGTTNAPVDSQGRPLGYLRDIWHAMQTQDVTFSEALFLLTQRPLNPNAAPPPGLSAHPQPLPEHLPAEPPPPPADPQPVPAEPPPAPPADPQPVPAEPPPAPPAVRRPPPLRRPIRNPCPPSRRQLRRRLSDELTRHQAHDVVAAGKCWIRAGTCLCHGVPA